MTLIAGGIGITPLRALLEALPGEPGDLTLIYRASSPRNVVFRDELETLARVRGARIHYLFGSRRHDGHALSQPPSPPLDRVTLARLVPDIADQDVYLCGPTGFMRNVEARPRRARRAALQCPRREVHLLTTLSRPSQRLRSNLGSRLATAPRTAEHQLLRRTNQCRNAEPSPSG